MVVNLHKFNHGFYSAFLRNGQVVEPLAVPSPMYKIYKLMGKAAISHTVKQLDTQIMGFLAFLNRHDQRTK